MSNLVIGKILGCLLYSKSVHWFSVSADGAGLLAVCPQPSQQACYTADKHPEVHCLYRGVPHASYYLHDLHVRCTKFHQNSIQWVKIMFEGKDFNFSPEIMNGFKITRVPSCVGKMSQIMILTDRRRLCLYLVSLPCKLVQLTLYTPGM